MDPLERIKWRPICYVDINDACNLKCRTCPRGVGLMPNSSRKMKQELFQDIINKARSEGYQCIGLYNWTEPFLNEDIAEYITMIKENGLKCDVSTNLSFINRFDLLEKALGAGIDRLHVSVSGYSQEVYEINHHGGNLTYVKNNLEHISKLHINGAVATEIYLRFIQFPYNISEIPLIKQYAKSLGIHLEVVTGGGDPYQPMNTYIIEDLVLDRIHTVYEEAQEQDESVCPIMMDTIAIDVSGKAFTCCVYPNFQSLEIGAYLDMTKDEIFLKRQTHPICSTCLFPIPRRKPTDSDCKTLAGYFNKIARQLSQKNQETENITRQLAQKNREVENILDSKSWRITAPFRKIYSWFNQGLKWN